MRRDYQNSKARLHRMNRDELQTKMQEYNQGYKDGLKVGIAQGRYEMGKVQWRRLFFHNVAGSIVGSSIGFFIGFLVAYWFIDIL